MFTDIVGYSLLAQSDEVLASQLLQEHRTVVRGAIDRHQGREHDTAGDGFFIEFASAVDAVQCAIEIQTRLQDRNMHQPDSHRLRVRIGLHLGDIMSEDEDLYGSGVNLAARIEPLARPGGVCLTRQIFDQVNGKIPQVEFRKLGRRALKNISGGAEVFEIAFPWQEPIRRLDFTFVRKSVVSLFHNLNSSLLAAFFLGGLSLLTFSTYKSWRIQSPKSALAARAPSAASPRIDLAKGWSFQVLKNPGTEFESQHPDPQNWQSFEPASSWKYSEDIHGKFWLKKTFLSGGEDFRHPAMVLGLIPDSHRLYLNGHFIGGSDQSSDLAYYPFDPKFLDRRIENTILVEADSRKILNPGLTLLPEVGAFIGEFSEVRAAVLGNQIRFHLLRNIYLSLSILIFSVALLYALFRKSSKAYFYYAFILLLGSVHLMYYSPWISGAFDYPFVRFLKVFGLMLTPFAIYSSYLSSQKRFRPELINNVAAAISVLFAALLLFGAPDTVTFTKNFNLILLLASLYTMGVILVHSGRIFQRWQHNLRDHNSLWGRGVQLRHGSAFHLGFELLSLVALVSSLKRGLTSDFISLTVHDIMVNLSMASPFLFAIAMMLMATADYIEASHIARDQRARDQLGLDVIRLIHESPEDAGVMEQLHQKLCNFVQARRSTLYVIDEIGSKTELLALSVVGRDSDRINVQKSLRSSEGILGYVCETGSPVLIQDIKRDLRFSGPHSKILPQGFASFETGSCMLIPLKAKGQLVGILTIADKKGEKTFSESDFSAALEVSSMMGLFLMGQTLRATAPASTTSRAG